MKPPLGLVHRYVNASTWNNGMESFIQLLNSMAFYLNSSWSQRTLQWRHNKCDGVSNHQPHDCLLNRLFKAQIKKSINARAGNSPVTGEFPAQRASNAENVSIWWRHHDKLCMSSLVDVWCQSQSISISGKRSISFWNHIDSRATMSHDNMRFSKQPVYNPSTYTV